MSDVDDLRQILQLGREFGASEIAMSGVRVVFGPPPKPVVELHDSDRDIKVALSEEDQIAADERADEAEHYRKWQRITRSSGAPIPKYVPPKRPE